MSVNVDDLPPQTRAKYCEEHGLYHVKNAIGLFVCPFCECNIDFQQQEESE